MQVKLSIEVIIAVSTRILNLQPSSAYLLRIAVENDFGLSDFSPVRTFQTQSEFCQL